MIAKTQIASHQDNNCSSISCSAVEIDGRLSLHVEFGCDDIDSRHVPHESGSR